MNRSILLLGSLLKSGNSLEISFPAEHRRYWKTVNEKSSHWNFTWDYWNIRDFQPSGTNQQFSKFSHSLIRFYDVPRNNLNSGAWDAASACSSGSLLNFS